MLVPWIYRALYPVFESIGRLEDLFLELFGSLDEFLAYPLKGRAEPLFGGLNPLIRA